MSLDFLKIFKKRKSDKNQQNKKTYDIKIAPHKSTIIFNKKDWKIEFSKKDLEKFFYSSRGKLISLFAILVLIFAIFGYFFFGRAEVLQFYPSSCLGGWQNPQNAALKPDLNFNAEPNEFNENNSAVLKNIISQIYCGNFSGDIPDSSNPKKAIIKFSWLVLESNQNINQYQNGEQINNLENETSSLIQIINLNENQSSTQSSTENSIQIFNQTSTENLNQSSTQNSIQSSESASSSQNNKINDSTLELNSFITESSSSLEQNNSNTQQIEPNSMPIQEPTPTNQQNIESSSASLQSFFDKLFKKVFAEEISASEKSINESTTISNIIESSTKSLSAPTTNTESLKISENASSTLNLASSSAQSSTENSNLENNSSSSNTSSIQNLSNENNFLEIFYTFDGSNWQSLGKVNFSNWKNLELEIPDFHWDQLPNLQIKIQSISPTEFNPTVYLDGMVLEVEYENELKNNNLNQNLGQNEIQSSTITNLTSSTSLNSEILSNNSSTSSSSLNEIIENNEEDENSSSSSVASNNLNQASTFQNNFEPLKQRKIKKEIKISKESNISCDFNPSKIDLSNDFNVLVQMKILNQNSSANLEIGSLPDGIDIVFLKNNDYVLNINSDESSFNLKISKQNGAQKGNFSIPIIYQSRNLTTLCQVNVINF